MLDFLIYDLKVAVLITVFYMFYRLLLSRETFHRVNRMVLLLTAVASFVLPLCVITMHETVMVHAVPEVSIGEVQASVAEKPSTPLWQIVLPILFIIGVLATLCHTLLSIRKVMFLIRQSEQHPETDGTIVCVTGNAGVAPFSWMHYIVMNRGDYEARDAAILAHERGHIRLRHSWDLLFVDLLTALQWFNPTIWMLRQDLRAIHEYEADGAVLSQGINARQYQYLLISKATSIGGYSIANGISHSTLKKRIHMMTNKNTRSSHLLKLLALVPIVGIALALNARTITDYVYDQPQKQQPVKKGKKTGTVRMGSKDIVILPTGKPSGTLEAETFTIHGVVKDSEKGDPIVGAVVTVSGSTKGTVTDPSGEFKLDVKPGDAVMAAYIGYASDAIVVRESQPDYVFILQKDGAADKGRPFDVVEEMPQFPGGPAALMDYLSMNVRYPEEAHKNNVQGRVIIAFVVEKDGTITEARVVKSVDALLDAEALRVVSSMPNWKPGKQNGEHVRVKYTVPITFKLQGKAKSATEAATGEKYVLEIDGNIVDDSEIANIPSGEVASMEVIKIENGQPKKIVITTKKKK